MKITGAIFDMDGTLIDSLMIWDVVWERIGKRFLNDPSFRPDNVTEKAVRTLTLREGMELVHKNCRMGESGEAVFRTSEETVRDFYLYEVKLKDGVAEFLDYCLKQGIKMCIATATAPELISIAMKTCRLERYFAFVLSCTEVGKGKEHPDVFIEANRRLGTPMESTWIFEDSVVALDTARRAGYQTVGIYDPYGFEPERVKKLSTEYIGPGQSMKRLIG